MVVVSLETSEVIDSSLRPSSDTLTHPSSIEPSTVGPSSTPIRIRDDVRAGADADSMHGDDTRGLLQGATPVTRPMRREEVEHDYGGTPAW